MCSRASRCAASSTPTVWPSRAERPQTEPGTLTQQLAGFYGRQLQLSQEQLAEFEQQLMGANDDEGNPVPADELDAIRVRADQHRRLNEALAAKQPYVRGLVVNLSALQLTRLLTTPAPGLKMLSTGPLDAPLEPGSSLGDLVLDEAPTNAEVVEWRRRQNERTADPTTSSQTPQAGTSSRAAAADAGGRAVGPTCDGRRERGVKEYGLPFTFMPNRHDYKTALDGAPDEQDLYNKITRMQFRWVDSGALAYFCGAPSKKRGFEPETKPVSNGNVVNGPEATLRWSGDCGRTQRKR